MNSSNTPPLNRAQDTSDLDEAKIAADFTKESLQHFKRAIAYSKYVLAKETTCWGDDSKRTRRARRNLFGSRIDDAVGLLINSDCVGCINYRYRSLVRDCAMYLGLTIDKTLSKFQAWVENEESNAFEVRGSERLR